MGRGIKNSGVPREEIWLTTKLDNPWHKRVQEGIDSSLKSLGTDYVDLYLMHWPSSTDPSDLKKHHPDWDYIKTWQEMQKLPATGKVRNIGVSNFGITHLEKLLNDPSCKVFSSSKLSQLLLISSRLYLLSTKSNSIPITPPQNSLRTTPLRVFTAPATPASAARTRLCIQMRLSLPLPKKKERLLSKYSSHGVFKRGGLLFPSLSTRNVSKRILSLMGGN